VNGGWETCWESWLDVDTLGCATDGVTADGWDGSDSAAAAADAFLWSDCATVEYFVSATTATWDTILEATGEREAEPVLLTGFVEADVDVTGWLSRVVATEPELADKSDPCFEVASTMRAALWAVADGRFPGRDSDWWLDWLLSSPDSRLDPWMGGECVGCAELWTAVGRVSLPVMEGTGGLVALVSDTGESYQEPRKKQSRKDSTKAATGVASKKKKRKETTLKSKEMVR
jgi:hypothetical protein